MCPLGDAPEFDNEKSAIHDYLLEAGYLVLQGKTIPRILDKCVGKCWSDVQRTVEKTVASNTRIRKQRERTREADLDL